ncbi:MAG: type II toxin-antitoxin system prevent-host-death family antitoxin [Clostridia bacterium]|nr:type II toxin-antitoxin system prevent-host-death family antitoxin [Clostridia bacterium]
MERVGIRYLKSHLSQFVARAAKGGVFLVTDRGKPVARLGPAGGVEGELRALAERIGVEWQGGKPRGLAEAVAPRLSGARSLSEAVREERAE